MPPDGAAVAPARRLTWRGGLAIVVALLAVQALVLYM